MSAWSLRLAGGTRDGEVHASIDLPPFLKFTTWDAHGITTDHFYGPTSTNQADMTAVYAPTVSPEAIWTMTETEFNRELAKAWGEGHESGFWNGRVSQLTVPYDAPAPDIGIEHAKATNPYRKDAP